MNQFDQPEPTPNCQPASWDLVLIDINRLSYGEIPPIVKTALISDIQQRDHLGSLKYKTRLQAFNGRDSLRDAYEESMDLVVYLRNCYAEGSVSRKTYLQSVKIMVKLRRIILERDGN